MLAKRSHPSLPDRVWFDAWGASFGPIRRVCGLAMIAGRAGPGLPVLCSATNPHSIHYDADPDVPLPPDLADRLLRESGAAMVSIDYVAADSRLFAAAREWRQAARSRVVVAPHAVTPVADCGGTFEAWTARRSKRLRQRVRRAEAEAAVRGLRATFTCEDPVESGLLARMFAVERAGWKGRGGTAILDDPATARFYADLAQGAAAAGAFRAALLWDGDRLVAFEYAVQSGTRLFALKVGYDEDYADLDPGYLLAVRHIEHACGDPSVDAYDKMGNGMTPAAYKLRFADRCEYLHRVSIYARGPRGTLLWAIDRARDRARAWRRNRSKAA